MTSALRVIALLSAFLAAAVVAQAQSQPPEQERADPGAHARFHWGALRFTPGIAVTNVGVDNNIFNDAEQEVSDTTGAFGPAVNFWMNVGALRVAGKSGAQYLYFKKYENQRSWNTAHELKLDLPRARMRPFVIGGYVNTRQRPGFEIDSRSRASINMATLGTDLFLSGKTTLVLSASRTTTAFDAEETFLGSELANELNRHSDDELLQLRFALTPLTTLVIDAQAIQDRFDNDLVRNADSIAVRPGFEFKPFALISGKVFVGFRHFNVLSDAIQDYQGPIAMVDVKYTLTTTTQIGATINRDLAFSYDNASPYYALADSALMLTQRIASSWDARAVGSFQSLAYRGIKDTTVSEASRTDRARMFGAGVGYLLGDSMRLGVDVNYYVRRSQQTQRNYDGLRAGASVSYGILQ